MIAKGVCYQSNLVDLDETAHWEWHPTKSDSEGMNVAAPGSIPFGAQFLKWDRFQA